MRQDIYSADDEEQNVRRVHVAQHARVRGLAAGYRGFALQNRRQIGLWLEVGLATISTGLLAGLSLTAVTRDWGKTISRFDSGRGGVDLEWAIAGALVVTASCLAARAIADWRRTYGLCDPETASGPIRGWWPTEPRERRVEGTVAKRAFKAVANAEVQAAAGAAAVVSVQAGRCGRFTGKLPAISGAFVVVAEAEGRTGRGGLNNERPEKASGLTRLVPSQHDGGVAGQAWDLAAGASGGDDRRAHAG